MWLLGCWVVPRRCPRNRSSSRLPFAASPALVRPHCLSCTRQAVVGRLCRCLAPRALLAPARNDPGARCYTWHRASCRAIRSLPGTWSCSRHTAPCCTPRSEFGPLLLEGRSPRKAVVVHVGTAPRCLAAEGPAAALRLPLLAARPLLLAPRGTLPAPLRWPRAPAWVPACCIHINCRSTAPAAAMLHVSLNIV